MSSKIDYLELTSKFKFLNNLRSQSKTFLDFRNVSSEKNF